MALHKHISITKINKVSSGAWQNIVFVNSQMKRNFCIIITNIGTERVSHITKCRTSLL